MTGKNQVLETVNGRLSPQPPKGDAAVLLSPEVAAQSARVSVVQRPDTRRGQCGNSLSSSMCAFSQPTADVGSVPHPAQQLRMMDCF